MALVSMHPDRRQFLGFVAGGAAAPALLGQRARRPNVLFILAEEWRAQATGYKRECPRVSVRLRVYGKERRLSAVVETHLLRIAGEAIANAIRHAKANEIQVIVDYSPASVRLQVTDDGCGFDSGALDPVGARHFGLLGMRERAAMTGGALALRTCDDKEQTESAGSGRSLRCSNGTLRIDQLRAG